MAEVIFPFHAFDFNLSLSPFQVERLYVEEERWEGEAERLREEADQLREQLSREVKAAQSEVSSSFVNLQTNHRLLVSTGRTRTRAASG